MSDIEITDDMIAAGIHELTGLVELGPVNCETRIVTRVYRAMHSARQEGDTRLAADLKRMCANSGIASMLPKEERSMTLDDIPFGRSWTDAELAFMRAFSGVAPRQSLDEVRATARIIYDAMYHPGPDEDDPMPPFEEAEEEGLGGYERAMEAARLVMRR